PSSRHRHHLISPRHPSPPLATPRHPTSHTSPTAPQRVASAQPKTPSRLPSTTSSSSPVASRQSPTDTAALAALPRETRSSSHPRARSSSSNTSHQPLLLRSRRSPLLDRERTLLLPRSRPPHIPQCPAAKANRTTTLHTTSITPGVNLRAATCTQSPQQERVERAGTKSRIPRKPVSNSRVGA
ncbi:hypothetical protein EX30DRAFT_336002, partial [Ascodesmis nigricans]